MLASLQNDTWLKERVEHIVCRACSKSVGETFSLKIESFDLLRGKMKIRSLSVSSSHEGWSFFCPETSIDFSWLSLFKGTGIGMTLAFSKPQIATRYEHSLFSIVKPFYDLLTTPSILPLNLTHCTTKDAVIEVTAPTGMCKLFCSSTTEVYQNAVINHISCSDGTITRNEEKSIDPVRALQDTLQRHATSLCAQSLTGHMMIEIPLAVSQNLEAQAAFSADFFTHKNKRKRCFISYCHTNGKSSFQWYPESREAFLRATNMHIEDRALKGSVEILASFKELPEFFSVPSWMENVEGDIEYTGQVSLKQVNDFSYQGTVKVTDFVHTGISVSHLLVNLSGNQHTAQGSLSMRPFKNTDVQGTWAYDRLKNEGTGDVSLGSSCEVASGITVHKASCKLRCSNEGAQAEYSVSGEGAGYKNVECTGVAHSDFHTLSCNGISNEGNFSATADLKSFSCTAFQYSKSGQKIVDLSSEGSALKGELNFEWLKDAIQFYTGHELQGQARVIIQPSLVDSKPVVGVSLEDAHIKVPFTHNFVKKGRAVIEYDRERRTFDIANLDVELNKGIVSSPAITVNLTPEGDIAFAHVPCTAHSLFVSWDKDIFGFLFGAVTAIYSDRAWYCQGSVGIDKGTVRGNLLSPQLQGATDGLSLPVALQSVNLDLHLTTRSPVEIKTSFFETQARVEGTLKGKCTAPQIAGSVELLQGAIFFPYKPLYITKGKLLLAPHMSEGPSIELIAKNKIKKYAVNMYVSGSPLDPKITFVSSPHLPEAAIMTLLLTGSEDASFYLAMSHMIMMHIKSILFGTPDRLSDAQKFFKGILTTLSKVRIVPTLNDQQVLEGTIEVDLTDRLRAKAQNNVNLSQETQLEVEYALSDDVSVKAVRDEKGAIGGELEMKWKF